MRLLGTSTAWGNLKGNSGMKHTRCGVYCLLLLILVTAAYAQAPEPRVYLLATSSREVVVTLPEAGDNAVVLKEAGAGKSVHQLAAKRGRVEITAQQMQSGRGWLVINPDPQVDYSDNEPPRLVELTADGRQLEYTPDLDLAAVAPQTLRLIFEDQSPLQPFELALGASPLPVDAAGITVEKLNRSRTALTLDLNSLGAQAGLKALGEADYPLALQVRARDSALNDGVSVVGIMLGDIAPPTDRAVFLMDLKPVALAAYGGMRTTPRDADKPGWYLKGRHFARSFVTIPHRDTTPAELVYELTPYPDHRIFRAIVGIADSAGSDGSVTFEVHVAGADGAWRKLHATGVLKAGGEVKALCLDLGAAQQLKLVVTACGSYSNDAAVWANPRLEAAAK